MSWVPVPFGHDGILTALATVVTAHSSIASIIAAVGGVGGSLVGAYFAYVARRAKVDNLEQQIRQDSRVNTLAEAIRASSESHTKIMRELVEKQQDNFEQFIRDFFRDATGRRQFDRPFDRSDSDR